VAAPSIVARNLGKRFGTRDAFRDLTFEVGAGEVFGFLGPNGAGKTTTVRVLASLLRPTSGSAEVAGVPLSPENGPELRSMIAVMPESPGLYLRLSVRDNLEYFAGLYGVPSAQVGSRIDAALEAVGLQGRTKDAAGSLSKGLRQRVSLARTLLSDPHVLFLDEPTSGLDPVATRGVTVFLTTHRLEEAERLCDRIAILNTTLRAVGSPEELRRDLFASAVRARTVRPLDDPGALLDTLPGAKGWRSQDGAYVISVDEPSAVVPELARRLVGAGADILELGEVDHSLEDVYLQLVDEDVEARS
jgi:ABC-2 type transport system ATP-binding protein